MLHPVISSLFYYKTHIYGVADRARNGALALGRLSTGTTVSGLTSPLLCPPVFGIAGARVVYKKDIYGDLNLNTWQMMTLWQAECAPEAEAQQKFREEIC